MIDKNAVWLQTRRGSGGDREDGSNERPWQDLIGLTPKNRLQRKSRA
jgi:hypothetical protein